MNNENKEISTNHDVEVNISEEEIVLAPQTELFEEAVDTLRCDSIISRFIDRYL